jgi:hypothetical protein
MPDQQRMQRAALVREQPKMVLFVLYSGSFFGGSLIADMLNRCTASLPSTLFERYFLPLCAALPLWLALRKWARRLVGE